jgi:hypothetical protein
MEEKIRISRKVWKLNEKIKKENHTEWLKINRIIKINIIKCLLQNKQQQD